MAEKSIDKVAEKVERLEVRRNTSNQIISYSLPEDTAMRYGITRVGGERTAFNINDFNRVLNVTPTELVNPIPTIQLSVKSKASLILDRFTEPTAPLSTESVDETPEDLFDDVYSARYELPRSIKSTPTSNEGYKTIASPLSAHWRSDARIPMSVVIFGPAQSQEGVYRITPELIETGLDLKMTVALRVKNNGSDFAEIIEMKLHRRRTDEVSGGGYSTPITIDKSMTNGQSKLLKGEYLIKNGDMRPYDYYEITATGETQNALLVGNGSYWNIEAIEDDGGGRNNPTISSEQYFIPESPVTPISVEVQEAPISTVSPPSTMQQAIQTAALGLAGRNPLIAGVLNRIGRR